MIKKFALLAIMGLSTSNAFAQECEKNIFAVESSFGQYKPFGQRPIYGPQFCKKYQSNSKVQDKCVSTLEKGPVPFKKLCAEIKAQQKAIQDKEAKETGKSFQLGRVVR